jgi:hypothetical protein
MKIRLVGADLFYEDRLRTDGRGHDEAGSCFSQFGEIVENTLENEGSNFPKIIIIE